MSEPLRKTVRVRCSTAHAFDVFTRRIDAWWPRGHRRLDGEVVLEPFVGGRVFERDRHGTEVELGRVLVHEQPDRLVYTWWPGAVAGPTHVEIRFVADGEQTRVDVEHREGDAQLGPEWPRRAQGFSRAWDDVLPAFAADVAR